MGRGNRRNQSQETAVVTDEPIVEPEDQTEEQEMANEEQVEAPAEPVSEPVVAQTSGTDVSAMTPAQILALLEQRRAEISTINKVAKERGIAIPTKTKPKVDDKDRLEEFIEGLGYSIGMRRWAQQRAEANWARIQGVLTLMGESFDIEKQAEAIELLGAGYIKAAKQTSFKSDVMKDKATREGATPGDVLEEFWASFDLLELPGLREVIQEAM